MEFGSFPVDKPMIVDGITFEDFNSFFEYVEMMFRDAIKDFTELFSPYPVEEWKLGISNSRILEPQILDYLRKEH